MARPLRIEFPGAWYHVMNRGASRRTIFRTNSHREFFLTLLGDTHEQFNAEWHAYCLMTNHYHLLVRTPNGNLQRIMRHVNGLYTQYFNRTEQRDGPLFRGRYRAILVDAQSYWLQLSRYIHRNPVEAQLVSDPADYAWSSYRAYTGIDCPAQWLTTDYVLKAIGHRDCHDRYVEYTAGGSDPELQNFYSGAKLSPVLGDSEFKRKALAGRTPHIDCPQLASARRYPSLQEITRTTCQHFNVDDAQIWRSTRGRGVVTPARSVAMYLCQRAGGMPLSEIARNFRLASYASAGASIRNLKRRLEEDEVLARTVESLLLDLTR